MYVNPFFAGVVSTILVELSVIVVFVATHVVSVREVIEDDDNDNQSK